MGREIYDIYHTLRNCTSEFIDGMKSAWASGGRDAAVEYIIENNSKDSLLLSLGGIWHNLASSYGIRMRVYAAVLEVLLGEGVIEDVGAAILECEKSFSGIGALVDAAVTAHEVGE